MYLYMRRHPVSDRQVEPQMEAPSGPLASSSVPENSKSESKTGASAGVTMLSTNTTPSHSSSHELVCNPFCLRVIIDIRSNQFRYQTRF